jgi:acyl-CoA synthetase (AMP-forming)/AMP-acid ligase II
VPHSRPDPDEAAAIFFTSGTTGAAKGVPRTHRAILDVIGQVDGDYGGSQGFRPTPAPSHAPPWIIFSPFGHLQGFTAVAYRIWIGRPVVLIERFSVADFATALHRYRFRTVHLPPAIIYMLATTELELDTSSLEYISSGTSFLSRTTQQAFEDRYHLPILTTYGMSETGTIAADTVADLRAGLPRRIGSVGRASRGVEIRILDDGKDVPTGTDGDIVVRSPAITQRYLGTNRLDFDDGWFHTGDVGHLDDDGYLYLLGRKLDRLVVGGLNVYPAEVEEAIRESPLVKDVVVVGLVDDRLGDLPVAGVIWHGEPDEDALSTDLRERLSHYKVPRRWFALDELPLTKNNKLDRRRALELATDALGD